MRWIYNQVCPPEDSDKKPPNPNGKKGGPEHQKRIDEIEKDIVDRGLTPRREEKVNTTGGNKDTRYTDIVAVDENGNVVERYQVGKQTQGGDPVSRERKALDDIENATGVRPTFVPYNK